MRISSSADIPRSWRHELFTGIIQEVGKIRSVKAAPGGKRITIGCREIVDGVVEGASIAVDGACLTVETLGRDSFSVFASPNTFKKTTLANKKTGAEVNLERPLTLGDELGGHMVLGHVDGVGKVVTQLSVSGTHRLEIAVPDDLLYGIIPEGSIAVNGVSLTVTGEQGNLVSFVIIPFTYSNTNLHTLRVGDPVNIESDVLGKYVYKFTGEGTGRRS